VSKKFPQGALALDEMSTGTARDEHQPVVVPDSEDVAFDLSDADRTRPLFFATRCSGSRAHAATASASVK
jgi:hypothetical protein